ncbi:MAG: hypothetical protein JXA68_06645 [Ignavibacteriales bacterium]|nr:hypothetical protein [Ignavibacteriales bacterium]
MEKILKLILFCIISTQVFSQIEDTSKVIMLIDTIDVLDNNSETLDEEVFQMQKSPWGAVLRSTIIPGLGQFYNESYWKIPIVWGLLTYYTSIWIKSHRLYWDNQEYYLNYKDIDKNIANDFKNRRDQYRDQRDEFAVYIGLVYFLTLVDAYVDAHLFDFDVGPDLFTNGIQFNVRIFPW